MRHLLIKCLFVAHWCKLRFARTSTLSHLSAIGFTKIVFQQNHFSRSYSHRMIILGTIPCPLLPKAVFWRRCQRQMQERYKVARVKTDSQFGRTSYLRPKGDKSSEMFKEHSKLDRREINSMKGSENIVRLFEEHWKLFGAALRRRMRAREMDKTGAVKSYLNGLWISHLSGDA